MMQQLFQQYESQGVMVLSPGWQESTSSCLSWANQFGLTYQVLSDMPTTTSRLFVPNQGGSYYFPHNCVIGQDQILRYTATGFSHSAVVNMINSLLEPEVTLNPTTMNFGTVTYGSIIDEELIIDNSGTGILQIISISTSNPSIFLISPTSGEVYAVDDELVVSVTFLAAESGAIDEDLTIVTNAGTHTVDLIAQVNGSGAFLWVNPREMDIGEVEVGYFEEQYVWAYNYGTQPATVSSISMTHSDFSVDPTSATIPSGDSIEVTVTYTPTTPGPVTDVLSFTSTGGNRAVDVSAMGMQAVIGGSVSTVNFGNVPINGFQTRNFRVRNLGNLALNISHVDLEFNIPSMTYSIQSTSIDPYDSVTCYLIWTPHSVGVLDGSITFESNGGDLVVDLIGEAQTAGVIDDDLPLPTTFSLEQNFPNPFNASTMIPFALPHSASVKIALYNTYGRLVKSFDMGEQPAGWHRVFWSGEDNYGHSVAAGIYFYRLLVDGRSLDLRKMLFLK